MREKATVLNSDDIARIIKRISHEIIERNKGSENIIFIGIRKRGVPLAKRIKENIEELYNSEIKLGKLDISFYRDDINEKIKSDVNITEIPFEIKGKDIILVDDVLFTGRTIRAAMDAIMDFGRPKSIQLVVLIDRGHRELPIRADYVGKNLPTSLNEFVEVKLEETDNEDKVSICAI
ncbi:MAG: bifunctional pyr operon transcriptional regulator/uracil phosphoribosyltransferase PyrR [Actinobacteria bacterium]|nr:bifunctional pyr operon transcriptional regulator/uracil phosphoribosyltransferase PyrR [Actinomycetota bacterium]MCL6088312.1 bifunctional pyr operon transcriptional regulator/uracil phosphoribosyltransferase PyrR [Actinomycetota bacterium]